MNRMQQEAWPHKLNEASQLLDTLRQPGPIPRLTDTDFTRLKEFEVRLRSYASKQDRELSRPGLDDYQKYMMT